MTKKEVTELSKNIFEKISGQYGYSKYHDTIPYLSIDDSPYADADDTNCFGEYDRHENEIMIYWKNIRDEEDIIRTILHEYQHYLQSPRWTTRYWNMGYCYHSHPYEIAAFQEEELWENYC